MADRTVTDASGRAWMCVAGGEGIVAPQGGHQGRDVMLTCSTPSVGDPVRISVGWQWQSMAPNGLARIINLASPAPRG